MQEEGTSAGLDGAPAPGMSRAARTADEAEAASKAAEDMTPVTYNYSFFHLVFALAIHVPRHAHDRCAYPPPAASLALQTSMTAAV